MEQLVGQFFGSYRLDRLLGEGGMGAVFQARHMALQTDVAIKLMHPHIARQPGFRERFLQEARAAAKLDHPGIVKVTDFAQAHGQTYIVMEFIQGDNLQAMLDDLKTRKQWIVMGEAVELIRQVSLALHYAHEQGIVHRDIKPGNIMLKPKPDQVPPYQPVITDLGLAKLAEGGVSTQAGTSMGTPAYMSPEQAAGRETDPRSDVYSLGILLYELTVGRLPFQIRTISEAIRCHTQEPPPPPRSLRPDFPVRLEAVILRALVKDPRGRFPNARALADALTPFVSRADTAATLASTEGRDVSLMTQYQNSLVAERGPSIMAGFPQPPAGLRQDRITVLAPDGRTQHLAIRPGGLTIGRAASNDLVLHDSAASRQHARVDFDGARYRVTDLNSTNGTIMGGTKLLPGVGETWTPDKAIRIGSHWLRLEPASTAIRADGSAMATVADAAATRAPYPSRPGVSQAGTFMDGSPPAAVESHLEPQRLQAGRRGRVTIRNRTNAPATFYLYWQDEARDLSFDPPQTQLDVAPGQQASAGYRATPVERPWVGRKKVHPFSVQVQPEDGEPRTHSGELVCGGRIPIWVPPLLVVLLVALVGGGIWGYSSWYLPKVQGTRTALETVETGTAVVATASEEGKQQDWSAGQTATALAEAATATQAYLVAANDATRAAIDATATWMADDDDGDGLENEREQVLGTLPDKADTDEDGLSDGDEANHAGTDPLRADSDGDGLGDGDEVGRGLDPLSVDSDGDGEEDAVDPFPLWTPTQPSVPILPADTNTPTPSPSPTPSPVPTPTPTPTATLVPEPEPTVVFRDGFGGSGLDTSKWSLDVGSGQVTVGGGNLRMSSSGPRFPYIVSRPNPFPAQGDFELTVRFRYPAIRDCGVAVMMSSCDIPAGVSQSEAEQIQLACEANGIQVGAWQDRWNGLQLWFRAGAERADIQYPGPDTQWHELAIRYAGGRYTLLFNGATAYTSGTTGYRPDRMWLGHPSNLGSNCLWNPLELDRIEVESLP